MDARVTPKRIQLSRTKGWRKPPNTVVVARPSVWGNPYRVVKGGDVIDFSGDSDGGRWHVVLADQWSHQDYIVSAWQTRADAVADAVAQYRNRATDGPDSYWFVAWRLESFPIRGKNLACWCPLDQPCHADVLLELANAPEVPRG